jgi:HlyD family secretion protein
MMFHRLPIPRLALLASVAALSLAGAARAAEPAPRTGVNMLAIPAVSLATASRRELTETLTVSGTLMPRDEVLIPAEVEGLRVTELNADEGDTVAAGQVLARLSRETLDAQLAQNDAALRRAEAAIAQANNQIPQAEAALTEAQSALQRTEALRQSGNTTMELLEQRTAAARTSVARLAATRDGLMLAQADKASAEAQRRELMVKMARTEIKAPVAGIVSRRTARIGSVSSLAGEPLFRLLAEGRIELEAEVLDTSLSRIGPGAAVTVTMGGREHAGQVRLMPAEVDRTTRIGKVRIAIAPDPALRIGAFARARVVVAQHTGIAVPSSAIAFGEKGASVQAVKDDKVEVRPVTTGISAEGFTEIVSGLAGDEKVVAKAMAFLRDGDTIRPIATAAAGGSAGAQ